MTSLAEIIDTIKSAPREFQGQVYIPKEVQEGNPEELKRTVSHEMVHALLSKAQQIGGPVGNLIGGARVLAGTLPDEYNPEEELAYRLEFPQDPTVHQLRSASRRERGPIGAFLDALYNGGKK